MKDFSQKWSPSSSAAGIGIRTRPNRSIHPATNGIRAGFKRGFDVLFAIAFGLVVTPLMLSVAAAITLTDGAPVLYSQVRAGRNGRRFRIVKFRTMRPNAEPDRKPVWAVTDDSRCTRLGAWLRRSGLDELPQLWNVLRGEMSIVGPRPERPEFAERFVSDYPGYSDRQRVVPGITGYAQVHGWRGNTDLGQRLLHDLHYIENWSLLLDLGVLVATIRYGWSERTRDGLSG